MDVLAATRLVEQLLVSRPRILVRTVVIEHSLGVLQGQRSEPGDLGGPRPARQASVPSRLARPVWSATSAVKPFGGQQHATGPARTDQ